MPGTIVLESCLALSSVGAPDANPQQICRGTFSQPMFFSAEPNIIQAERGSGASEPATCQKAPHERNDDCCELAFGDG